METKTKIRFAIFAASIMLISIISFANAQAAVSLFGGIKDGITNTLGLNKGLKAWKGGLLDWIATGTSILQATRIALESVNAPFGGKVGRCYPETKLPGTDKCASCNEDPYMICTKQRCEMLGTCTPVAKNDTGDDYICLAGDCTDKGLVAVNTINARWYEPTTKSSKSKDGTGTLSLGTIPYDIDNITLSISTNLHARCAYSIDELKTFSDSTLFKDNYAYPTSQSVDISVSRLERGKEHFIYLKCKSACGDEHEQNFTSYYVKFRFEPKPETMPPKITFYDPDPSMFQSGKLNELEVVWWLDENGYCKYSTLLENLTTEWKDMVTIGSTKQPHPQYSSGTVSVKQAWCEQNKECSDTKVNRCSHCHFTLDLTKGYSEFNWSMNETLARLTEFRDITKVFVYEIRCADFGKDGIMDSSGQLTPNDNIMPTEDVLEYTLFTVNPYNVTIIKPKMNEKVDEKEIEVEVSTSRETKCRYSINGDRLFNNMTDIDDGAFGKTHTMTISNLPGGLSHEIIVRCRDAVNLEVLAKQRFYVEADIFPPQIIRAYKSTANYDILTVITNEKARCVWSSKDCSFNFDDGSLMASRDDKIHSEIWNADKTYYIKCKDLKNNTAPAGTCTSVIKPFEVASTI